MTIPKKKKLVIPDIDSVVEDIVVSVMAKVDTDKLYPERKKVGVVDRSDALDLVVRSVLNGMLGESDKPTDDVWYHGSQWPRSAIKDKTFDDVKPPVFFTKDKNVAREYATRDIGGGGARNNRTEQKSPTIYTVQVKTIKTLDLREKESQRIYDIVRHENPDKENKLPRLDQHGFIMSRTGLPSFGQALVILNLIKSHGYDSALFDEGSQGISLAISEIRGKTKIIDDETVGLKNQMSEAEEVPKELSRGIAHIDDLKPEEFMKFIEKYKDIPLKGGLEISEKVDGSAQMSFGVSGGKVWTKSKHGTVKTDASQYPDGQMHQAVKRAHMALSPLGGSIPEGMTFISDVLWTRIPNSIEYGDNRIIVHGVFSQGKQIPAEEQKRIVDELATDVSLSDDDENWKLEFKRTLDPAEVMVDVKTEYESLAQIYDELKKLIPDKLKALGKGPYKEALARFQVVQSAVKKKLISQLRKQSSAYGQKGGDVEGLVFRDLDSGAMTKLVDKEYFTKLNQFLWRYRELLDKGAKVGDQWQHGVMQKFRNAIADNVLGSAIAKTPGFVSKLAQFDDNGHANLDNPEEKVDFVLAKYIESQKLMAGDNFVGSFGDQIELVRAEFEKLRAEWDEKKTGDLGFDVRDDSGAVSKRVKMDKIIVGRTDTAFVGMQDFLDGTAAALPKVAAMKNTLTQKVALMKLFLGQTRLEKLKDAIMNRKEESSQKFEAKQIRELDGDEKQSIIGFVKTFSDKLVARGLNVGSALGSGANGIAFNVGGGKVLKITTDLDEVASSFHLMGKDLKRFCKIYDVFRFPDREGGEKTQHYGIVQEKLTPLSTEVRRDITRCCIALWDLFGWKMDWENDKLQKKAQEIVDNNPQFAARAKETVATYVKYDLGGIFRELKSHGVIWRDMHADNLMFRGDVIVGLDLGVSDAPGTEASVPVLELKAKRDMKKLRELSHDDDVGIRALVKSFEQKLASKGLKPGAELGKGAKGIAYDVGGGKVLKVTSDATEAKSSFHLVGKNLKRFCKIFDVFRFPGEKEYYGVVQEKLQKLTNQELGEIAECWGTLWDYFREINIPDLRAKAAKISSGNPPLKRQMDTCVAIYEKYGLKEIFDELKSHGINWEDMHPENLMRRGDTIVGLDLGISDAPDGGTVPMLETEADDTRKSMFQAAPPADPEDDVDVRLAKRKLDNTELVLNFAAKLKARGVVIPSNPHEVGHLGTGSKGTAIALQDGRVIKVTIDVEEAKAAFKLKGMKLKHIVKIDDVFQFPKSGFGIRYGIVQELLKPIPGATVKPAEATGEAKVLNKAFSTSFFDEGLTTAKPDWESVFAHMRKRLSKYVSEIGLEGSKKLQKDFYDAFEVLKKYGIPGMVQELFENGIKFQDYHAGNIMRRPSGDYVLIDLGYSKVEGGATPPVLERMVAEGLLKLLGEARADQVGVTIGRYQPFHKGHAEIIRELAKKFDKVLVIVAGNTVDKKNPFSFDTRLELMKRSLPDVISKVEIHKAQMDGKGSGYLPGVLSNIIRDKNSTLEADVAVQILVGEDRVAEYKKQMDHAIGAKEKPGAVEMYFDPNLATVGALPGVKNDGDDDRISATRIREALAKDDRASVEKMMDPHLVSNPADFEKLYVQMKKDLGVKPGIKVEGVVDEDLSDIGGDQGVDSILDTNAKALLNSRWKINVGALKRLGSGMEGIAFDMGQGRVLKITADEGEAKTSFGLKSKTDLNYVVKIFDVFRFKNTAGINHPVFGLVTEKLSPLSSTEAKEFDHVTEEAEVQMGKQHYLDVLYEGDWDKLVAEMRLAFEKDIAKESGLPAGNPRLARVLQARMDRYIPVYEKYKIPEMMKELRGAGIKFADYHSGNLMKRGAQYVINDIGRSKTTSVAEPPTLGEIVESIIGSIKESPFAGGFGSTQSGVQAGSSAWSSSKNRPDPSVPDLWQNQLTDLDTFHSGSADEK